MPAFRSVRGTEDYLTSRAANPVTGIISPSVYGPPTPATPRTPGEVLALRGDFTKTPDNDDRRPSGAQMLNEYFGLGKKKQKFPVLKRRGADMPSKLADDNSSQFTASTSSSRPSTSQSISSLRSVDSDAASITSSEANFSVKSPNSAIKSTHETEPEPPVTDNSSRARSGTIVRVAAYWSGIKESLATTQPLPTSEECEPPAATVYSRPASERLQDMRCLDDDTRSASSGVSPLTKRPREMRDARLDHKAKDTRKASAELARKIEGTGRSENLMHLPSVRLVHPSLAAVPGVDRRKDRVTALPELMKQNQMDNEDSLSSDHPRYGEPTILPTLLWIAKKLTTLGRLLIGPFHIEGVPEGSLLDGAIALVRLLILAYLVYCSWLVLGLISDVIQAVCWPFRVFARFVEWLINS